MKKNYFIIKLSESITVKEASGEITRNSNGSQWFAVELDGWLLGEGEALYVTFELENEVQEFTTRVGPLQLFYDSNLEKYASLIPPEVISKAGEWKYSIEKRFNITDAPEGEVITKLVTVTDKDGNVLSETVTKQDNGDKVIYSSITSSIKTLNIIDSVMRASETDAFVKETELVTAAAIIAKNSNTALEAANSAEKSAERAGELADMAKQNADLSESAAEVAKEAAKISTSKAIVIWGINKSVEISELEWEVL